MWDTVQVGCWLMGPLACRKKETLFSWPLQNEEKELPATLECARRGGGRDVEIIVVDGGSSDGTVGLAQRQGCRVIKSGRGRGTQCNAGWR